MSHDPVLILAANAALQVLVATLLGWFMLLPMQPWGRRLAGRVNQKALLSTHLDLLMLAFMQWGAAFIMSQWPATRSVPIAALLVFGGWVNPTPYLFRGFGVNAFVLAGAPRQWLAALLGGTSSLAILVAWSWLVYRLFVANG